MDLNWGCVFYCDKMNCKQKVYCLCVFFFCQATSDIYSYEILNTCMICHVNKIRANTAYSQ